MCFKCQQGWRRESVVIAGPVTEVVVPKPAGAASSGRSTLRVLPKDPWNRVCIWPTFWVISVPPNTREGVHRCMTTFTQAFDSNYLLVALKCTKIVDWVFSQGLVQFDSQSSALQWYVTRALNQVCWFGLIAVSKSVPNTSPCDVGKSETSSLGL